MSPKTLGPNDVLQDDNYFLWEFNARMALARKNLLSHVQVKSENAVEPRSAKWEASDMKALGILVQLLSPNYQAMVREAKSAREAWETLRTFFVQTNLHNQVQQQKGLHGFEMAPGEKLVILLGSLPAEYDGMIKIIEAHGSVTLLDAKEMLRREFETIKKRERQEEVFKAVAHGAHRAGDGNTGEFVFSVSGNDRSACWLLDSGASSHMSFDRDGFCEYRTLDSMMTVTVANGQKLQVRGVGSVRFSIGGSQMVKLTDVLFVPQLDRKLLSIASLIAKGADEGELFPLPAQCVSGGEEAVKEVAAASTGCMDAQLWHARLGHIGALRMSSVARAVDGVSVVNATPDKNNVCAGCAIGKLAVSAFPHRSGSAVKTAEVLELIHSDVMGPMQKASKGGARYVVTIIDDFSRYHLVEKQTEARVKCLRSDNGTEYVNKRLRGFCRSAPYSPQQNGLDESMNRTIVEMARSMVHYMGHDLEWWSEAVNAAVYTINRLPNTARASFSPFEVFYVKRPDLSHLRVFGSRGFVHVNKVKRSKRDAKAHRCIFLRLDENPPATDYNLPIQASGGTCAAHWPNVDAEDTGGLLSTPSPAPSGDTDVPMDGSSDAQVFSGDSEVMEVDQVGFDDSLVPVQPAEIAPRSASGNERLRQQLEWGPATLARSLPEAPRVYSTTSIIPLSREGEKLVFTGGSRPRMARMDYLPRILPNFESPQPSQARLPASDTNGTPAGTALTYNAPELLENGPATSEVDNAEASSGDELEPDSKRQRVDDGYEIVFAAVELPRNYRDAVESPEHEQWKKAIRAELQAHLRNHTWDLVRKPPGAKVIGHKWVFAIKRDEHGAIVRFKARLVGLGCLQTFGVDYTDTYSPVASMNTVRTFLAACCSLKYYAKLYDIETAFLNGDLSEKVYMTVPAGMKVAGDLVCQLRRSLYGLKQQGGRTPVFVVLYVDDLLVGCLHEEDADDVRRELAQHFTVKALGDVRYVLGMEAKYEKEKGELWLGQKQFIERMVKKFRQEDAYPMCNPTVLGQNLHVAVGVLSRYLEQPREKHWKAAIRILRYLKGTSTSGIKFHRSKMNACSVEAFCDANWGGDVATRRSTAGIIVQVAGGPVIYKSKLQQTVALSSAEAEYMSMALAVQEVVWLRQLLEGMGLKSVGATPVFVDNKSAISMATNHGYTPRAKHIDLRAHFVRDHVSKETMK
ncbi:polyprotein [Phytophthora palmivora]|uniref:Polyprotein n=1 Tax=Phytophthora palmivora TaxID=4796 RepID=A0A2P4XB93_9STRA|nr:polyprotein [Phytophthora palmivora]